MKKITPIFYLFLSLHLAPAAWAQAVPECPVDDKSLEVIDPKESKSIELLKAGVMRSACNADAIFSEVDDPKFSINHNRLRCAEVDMCMGETEESVAVGDASAILKEAIPKAALLNLIAEQLGNNFEYNILLNRIENSKKAILCPVEKIEPECDKKIQGAVAAVGRQFLIQEQLIRKSIAETEPMAFCSARVTLNQICRLSERRVRDISDCESNNEKGCLGNEQIALAHLLNDHKQNKALYLSLEKQLCTTARIVQDGTSQLPSFIKTSALGGFNLGNYSLRMKKNSTGLDLDKAYAPGLRAPASEETEAKVDTKTSTAPSDADLIRNGNLNFDMPKHEDKEEIKSFEKVDGYKLSEQFSNSFNEVAQKEDNQVINKNASANTAWNSDFSNRFNSITEEEKKKKEKDEEDKIKFQERAKLEEQLDSNSSEKKKNEEMNALIAQINGLKAKIETMNASVDELKSKKSTSVDGKDKVDKEALEREKAILDLKKKLTELEDDKKKREQANLAKAARDLEDERNRSKEEVRKKSQVTQAANYSNRGSDKIDEVKREQEKAKSAFNQTAASFAESRVGAAVAGASASSSTASSGLILKTTGTRATAESAVVYMTAGELQKYPFHLNANASSVEIEKMILGNNGASIILGNNEQIIPVTENGVVQLDELGKVKYKRIKISLVKNERERKQSIAREISSVADLKREEQRKRDLIRYQEMKNALKKATDKK